MYREQFPIFKHYPQLTYFDQAATSQKPQAIIDAIVKFYTMYNANVHRGVYQLSAKGTALLEQTRQKVATFMRAQRPEEIIFTRGATDALNLVSSTLSGLVLQPDDEIILSVMEHHANLIPWQRAAARYGAKLRFIPLNKKGELELDIYRKLLNSHTKIVAITHVSNVLGTINPIKTIVNLAHDYKAVVVVDGAQAAAHLPIDVQDLDTDFYLFSAHKSYGPTGVGILYGKLNYLEQLPPFETGGDMIEQVTLESATFAPPPQKFEAGTLNLAGIYTLGAMIDFINGIGFAEIRNHEQQLMQKIMTLLSELPGINFVGTSAHKIGLISFTLPYAHPHDIATVLDQFGVAIRAGHHCAMPLMDFYNLPGTARISLGIDDTDAYGILLKNGLNQLLKIFKG